MISGPPQIDVNAGEVTSYTFSVNDTDAYSVILDVPELISEQKLVNNTDGTWTYEFTWTHEDTTNFTVTFVATDSFNSSSILQPQVLSFPLNC